MARKSSSSYKSVADKRKEKIAELKKKVDTAYRISRDRGVNKNLEDALALIEEIS